MYFLNMTITISVYFIISKFLSGHKNNQECLKRTGTIKSGLVEKLIERLLQLDESLLLLILMLFFI